MRRRNTYSEPAKRQAHTNKHKVRRARATPTLTGHLWKQLDQLTRERDEALKQQTAASEVLRVISTSPGDLESVFRSILVNANRICEAHFGTIFRYDGKALVVTAWEGVPPKYLALLQSAPIPVNEQPVGQLSPNRLST
jgi:hypothetical protein